jgi:hypothetical protein
MLIRVVCLFTIRVPGLARLPTTGISRRGGLMQKADLSRAGLASHREVYAASPA